MQISGNKNIVVRNLDLRSLDSVRDFARIIILTENRIDVLVNNAGVGGAVNRKSKDGIELGYQVNHYGHFLLTNLLIGNILFIILIIVVKKYYFKSI